MVMGINSVALASNLKNTNMNNVLSVDYIKKNLENCDNVDFLEDSDTELVYTCNGITTTVTQDVNNNKEQQITICEDGKTDVLKLDLEEGNLYIDDSIVTCTEESSKMDSVNTLSTYEWGDPVDVVKGKVTYEKKLSLLTRTTIGITLTLYTQIPGALANAVAGDIVDKLMDSGYASSEATYYIKYKQLNLNDYSEYRNAWDMYWDKYYQDYLDSYYQTIYSGNSLEY